MSKATIALGAYIVISAAFMLQVRNWLFGSFGDFAVATSFRVFFILAAILTIIYGLRMRLSIRGICAIACIFILGYLFSMWQEYFSEKTHVLTYGLLGYLAMRDLSGEGEELKRIAAAVIFVSFISAMDETFQRILPYRYGELKDFITNIISGALGITLFKVVKKQRGRI